MVHHGCIEEQSGMVRGPDDLHGCGARYFDGVDGGPVVTIPRNGKRRARHNSAKQIRLTLDVGAGETDHNKWCVGLINLVGLPQLGSSRIGPTYLTLVGS